MSTLRTITLGEAIEVHCDHIDRYGGQAGIRHTGALKHATGQRPLHIDAFSAAAGYILDFMTARPFPDANARVALVTALVFLDLNGITIDATDDELIGLVEGVRGRGLGATKLAEFFQTHQCPADRPRNAGTPAEAAAESAESPAPALDRPMAPATPELPPSTGRKERLTEMAQFFREDDGRAPRDGADGSGDAPLPPRRTGV